MRKNTVFCPILALVVALWVLSFSVCGFSDVDSMTEEGKAITKMQNCGYINGYGDNTFRPQSTLTRAEFVTVINKMYRFTVDTDNVFTDVSQNDWFYKDVLVGVQAGYIKGMGDGTFKPNEPVTREQVCVMLDSILKIDKLPFNQKIADEVSDWARSSVEKMLSVRMFTLEQEGKFRATRPITRSEACVALEKCVLDIDINIKPIDLENIAREEALKKLEKVVKIMQDTVIPSYTYNMNVKMGNRIVDSMKKYIENPDYDYIPDAKETHKIYNTLNSPDLREFKDSIYKNFDVEELSVLLQFFYKPEIKE